MTTRTLPEVPCRREALKETRWGWFNATKAGINCPFSQPEFTAEGSCAPAIPSKRDEEKCFSPSEQSHSRCTTTRTVASLPGRTMQERGFSWETRWLMRNMMAGAGPSWKHWTQGRSLRYLCGYAEVAPRPSPFSRLSGGAQKHGSTTGNLVQSELCSKRCCVPSITNEARETKPKLLAKSWILPVHVLGL